MKKILILSNDSNEAEEYAFLLNNNSFDIDWNSISVGANYNMIFFIIQEIDELKKILKKYNLSELEFVPKLLIFKSEIKEYYNEKDQKLGAVISLEMLKMILAQNKTTPTANSYDGIFFKVKNRLEKIIFKDIISIQAKDIYSIIKTKEARFLVSHTLREIDETLRPFQIFQRIHRSYIVNLSKIEAIEDKNVLIVGEYLPIGQAYREALFERLLFV